jgi:hypothetical protein
MDKEISQNLVRLANHSIKDIIDNANDRIMRKHMDHDLTLVGKPTMEMVSEDTLVATAHVNSKAAHAGFEVDVELYKPYREDQFYLNDTVDFYAKELVEAFLKEMKQDVKASTKIMAAGDWADEPVEDDNGEDTGNPEVPEGEDGQVDDKVDDLADAVDDVKDAVDDVQEDDTIIETENNIANHYIAECDVCFGVFISSVVESDQKIDHITGECPLCGKNTEQYLKWVVKPV